MKSLFNKFAIAALALSFSNLHACDAGADANQDHGTIEVTFRNVNVPVRAEGRIHLGNDARVMDAAETVEAPYPLPGQSTVLQIARTGQDGEVRLSANPRVAGPTVDYVWFEGQAVLPNAINRFVAHAQMIDGEYVAEVEPLLVKSAAKR